jgi:hypothetical protein
LWIHLTLESITPQRIIQRGEPGTCTTPIVTDGHLTDSLQDFTNRQGQYRPISTEISARLQLGRYENRSVSDSKKIATWPLEAQSNGEPWLPKVRLNESQSQSEYAEVLSKNRVNLDF